MTIYQEEMQRKAQRYGCITDYDEADQLLLISHKGVHLTAVNPEGFMFYNSKELTDPESREVFSHLVNDAETVREYVGLYESSPQMEPKDVQNYRKLSEYGDVVFAGMYSQKHGFMFCSWRQSDGGKLSLANSSYCHACSGLSPPNYYTCRAHKKPHPNKSPKQLLLGCEKFCERVNYVPPYNVS